MIDQENRSYYESPGILAEYLLFHYGTMEEVLPFSIGPADALDYPVRCIAECLDTEALSTTSRALDLGCAVGRSSFELARHAGEVVGIDSSSRFIEAAETLRLQGRLPFSVPVEGTLTVSCTALVPSDIPKNRVRFQVGDALNLPSKLGRFDVVLLANLIDRLPRPADLIRHLPSLVNPDGQLIISSPYTWLEEFTPRDQWLGGFERNGHPVTTFDTLHDLLNPFFELKSRQNLPFLIREHSRKFQWSVAEATTWRRRSAL